MVIFSHIYMLRRLPSTAVGEEHFLFPHSLDAVGDESCRDLLAAVIFSIYMCNLLQRSVPNGALVTWLLWGVMKWVQMVCGGVDEVMLSVVMLLLWW